MKSGLVLEGGAVRTIYSSGVCDGFIRQQRTFDYVVGVSAGIAYGASYLSGQFGRNMEITEKYIHDRRYMGLNNLLRPGNRSYFGLDFVYDRIPNELVPFDYEAYAAYPGQAEAVVTDVETGKPVYFPIDRADRQAMLLRATCALPLLFPIQEYQGVKCMDGGCVDSIPWKRAFDQGCDRVVVVLTREASYRRQPESSIDLIRRRYRKYPAFVAALETRAERYNREREELFQVEKEGRVMVFMPENTQGFSRTERDMGKIRALWQSGLDAAAGRAEELNAFLTEE